MVVVVVALLVGCGGGSEGGDTDNSAEEFPGKQRAEAQVVEDFSDAAGREDWATICDQLFTAQAADQKQGLLSDSCDAALADELEDNHDMNLTVTKVTRLGGSDTVTSKDDEGNNQSFEVVQEGDAWRIDAYGGTFAAD
jgi:hypothetical protein